MRKTAHHWVLNTGEREDLIHGAVFCHDCDTVLLRLQDHGAYYTDCPAKKNIKPKMTVSTERGTLRDKIATLLEDNNGLDFQKAVSRVFKTLLATKRIQHTDHSKPCPLCDTYQADEESKGPEPLPDDPCYGVSEAAQINEARLRDKGEEEKVKMVADKVREAIRDDKSRAAAIAMDVAKKRGLWTKGEENELQEFKGGVVKDGVVIDTEPKDKSALERISEITKPLEAKYVEKSILGDKDQSVQGIQGMSGEEERNQCGHCGKVHGKYEGMPKEPVTFNIVRLEPLPETDCHPGSPQYYHKINEVIKWINSRK